MKEIYIYIIAIDIIVTVFFSFQNGLELKSDTHLS